MARGIRNEKVKRVTGWASEKKESQDIIKPLERGYYAAVTPSFLMPKILPAKHDSFL